MAFPSQITVRPPGSYQPERKLKLFGRVASLAGMKTKVGPKVVFLGLGGLLLLAVVVLSTGALRKPKPIAPEKIVTSEKGDIARSVVARGKI